MAKEVIVKADQIKRRKRRNKILEIIIIILLLLLIGTFLVLSLIYNGGKFTIGLSRNLQDDDGVILYNNSVVKRPARILTANYMEFMDNISINWIPKDIDDQAEGPHNGKNYIAYTFYVENQGEKAIDYWYMVAIDEVVKNVDEAVRIMIFRNGEKTVYAKLNSQTNNPEPNTKEFYNEQVALIEKVENFKVGDIDKYTIVIWLEGDDPDCTNNLIGGEMKMHMEITKEGEVENNE